MPTNKRILGIDPGFDRVGVAIIEGPRGKEKLIFSCCLETSKKDSHENRLANVYEEVEKIIKKFKPDVLAIEKLFFNKNATTALKVAEGKGVIMAIAAKHGLKCFEYSPPEVKASVTGYGKADKDQLAFIISKTIALEEVKKRRLDDEFDAIGIAVTHSLKNGLA